MAHYSIDYSSKADFVKVRLHCPTVDGITEFTGPHQALTAQSVACIDLVTKFKGIPLLSHHIPHFPPSKTFGFVLDPHLGFGRLGIVSFIPGLYSHDHLNNKNLTGTFLLAINGIAIRSVTESASILDDFETRKDEYKHARLAGFTFLFG